MKRILLTGARAPVTLDLVRHFHRAGHEVYLADSIHLPLARLTRFAKKTFVVPKPALEPTRFVEALASIAERYRIDVLIPTCEEIFYVSARLDLFASSVTVFADPLAKLESLHNKWTFAQHLRSLSLPANAPETHLLTHPDALAPWMKQGDSQRGSTEHWVFKPVYSRFASRTLIGPALEELRALTPSESDPWVAQRRIYGSEFSTYSIAKHGKLRAHCCYRSKYRAGPGSGIYFLPVKDQRICDFVHGFVQQHAFTGQIGFDFMQDGEGQLYVLECNPRATSGLHMLDGQPISQAFFEPDGPVMEPISDRPAMLASVMFLFAFPEAVGRWRMGTFFRDMVVARDVMFAWNDPLPALLSPLSLVEVILSAIRTRKPLTRAATYDIEWNGEPM